MAERSWLQSTYAWDAAALEARPAQQTKETATSQPRRAAAVCQVEGCGADLTHLRYFFRKQRICEHHARADVVTDAAGRQLRFCQQCTRLEPLANFTVGRRSCKASLAKRQARAHRGKAHSSPDSSPERTKRRTKTAGPKRQVGKPTSSWSDEDSATAGSGNGSKGSRRSAGGPASKRSRGSSPSFDAAPSHAGGRSPGLQSAAFALPSDSPAVLGPPVSLGSSGRRNSDSLADASQLMMHPQQEAAAAVAAMQLQQHQLRAAGMGQAAAAAAAAVAPQQQAQQAQQGDGMDWCQYLAADELEELLAIDPDMLADTLLADGGPSTGPPSNGSGQASLVSHNSHWQPGAAAAVGQPPLAAAQQAAVWGGAAPAAAGQQVPAQPMQALPMASQPMQALGVPPLPGPAHGPGLGAGPQLAYHPAAGATGYAAGAAAGTGPSTSLAPASLPPAGLAGAAAAGWAARPAAAQAAALQQQAGGVAAAAQGANPAYTMARFSLKIFGVAPDDLPLSLRAEMFAALQVSPTVLEGAIRCGCTHLIVDLLLTRDEASQVSAAPHLAAAVRHLRRPDHWARFGASPAIVAQLNSMIALGTAAAENGGPTPLPCIHLKGTQLLPALALACPAATTTSAAAGQFQLHMLSGGRGQRSAAELASALHCRSHGRLVGTAVSVLRSGSSGSAAERAERAGQAEAEEESSLSSDAELDGTELADLADQSDGEAAAGAAAGEAAAGVQRAVLQAWAPDALKPECWGLYEFELSSGSLLSEAVPVLVLPDAHAGAAAELCHLQAEEAAGRVAPGTTSAIVRLVAAVLRFLRLRQAAEAAGAGSPAAAALDAAYPPAVAMRLASAACHLVVFAVAARWPQLAALVLPAVTADGSSPAAAAQQLAAMAAPARSPLHLALASGSAPTLAALRGWAAGHGLAWEALQPAADADSGGGSQSPAAAEEAALDDLLLLAAAMGSSLEADMVQQLTELLGEEHLARSADAAGPAGWSPRRVAQATDNAALLAALPPEPEATSSAAAAAAAAGEDEEEEEEQEEEEGASSEQRWEELQAGEECAHLQVRPEKLAALEEEWAASKAAAAAAGGKGWPARPRRRRRAPPSHDAALLASLMEEMHVGGEEQAAAEQPAGAGRLERQGSSGLTGQLVKTSLAGAAAAVVAALATVAVRLTLLEL